MASFPTHGILSTSTGILMGDIGGVYEVVSYLLERPAFTHELAHYGRQAAEALQICHPELPATATTENWQEVRDSFIAEWGETRELDPALKGLIADDKNPAETLRAMGFGGKIIGIQP